MPLHSSRAQRLCAVASVIVPVLLAATTLGLSAPVRADKLRRAGAEIRDEDEDEESSSPPTPSPSSHKHTHSRSAHARDVDEEDDPDDDVPAWVYMVFYPWTLPYAMLEPGGASLTRYAPYPYADGAPGLLSAPRAPTPLDTSIALGLGESTAVLADTASHGQGRTFAVQGSVETSYVWGNVGRYGAVLRLLTPSRLELDTSWSLLSERASDGSIDWVGSGTTHVTWRFAQSQTVQFRTGIGTRHWIDAQGHELGGDVFYGIEAMIGRPMVLSLELHMGGVASAFVWQARGGLGLMLAALELYLGYDHTQIGDVELGGPMLGARVWL